MRKPLTSLRAFVVFFVFITHLRFLYQGADILDFHEAYMGNGDICVTFFFVLSGLVFSLGYGERFKRLSLRDWAGFVWKRLKKLYPLYIVTILVMLAWDAVNYPNLALYLRGQARDLLLAVTLTQTYFPWIGTSMIYNGAAWFLSAMFAIYLVTPLLLRLNCFVRNRPWASCLVLALAIAGHCAYQTYLVYGGFSDLMRSELGYFNPAGRVIQFVAGIMLGNLVLMAEDGKRVVSLKDDPVLAGGLEFAAVLLWLGAFVFMPTIARELVPEGAPIGFQYLISYPVHLLTSCFLVWVFAQGAGGVSHALSARPLVELGKVSYEFFLIHWVVIHALGIRLVGADPNAHLAFLVVFMLVASLAFAVLWHWLGTVLQRPWFDSEPTEDAYPQASS